MSSRWSRRPRAEDPARGELPFNPERVLALAERRHRLYALWTDDPLGGSTVGPMSFGHLRELPSRRWREALREVRPDVVYALLNWRAVPLAHQVLRHGPTHIDVTRRPLVVAILNRPGTPSSTPGRTSEGKMHGNPSVVSGSLCIVSSPRGKQRIRVN